MAQFSFRSGLIRIVSAVVLVFATYNPTNYSYFHWVQKAYENPVKLDVLIIFTGVGLLIIWVEFLRATFRSLGPVGFLLASAFFGTLLWLIVDYGLVPADNAEAVTWLVLVAFSGVLGAGMSWSHIRRRVSGQLDTDDSEDG